MRTGFLYLSLSRRLYRGCFFHLEVCTAFTSYLAVLPPTNLLLLVPGGSTPTNFLIIVPGGSIPNQLQLAVLPRPHLNNWLEFEILDTGIG